ncbi:MAG: hypothetical protein ACK493_07330 [Planctomycetota bacterium]
MFLPPPLSGGLQEDCEQWAVGEGQKDEGRENGRVEEWMAMRQVSRGATSTGHITSW